MTTGPKMSLRFRWWLGSNHLFVLKGNHLARVVAPQSLGWAASFGFYIALIEGRMSVTDRWTVADITNIVCHMPYVSVVCLKRGASAFPWELDVSQVFISPYLFIHNRLSLLYVCLTYLQGWRDCSIGRMFVVQARRPELKSPAPSTPLTPVLG